jgi:hypothetical protein
LAILFGDNHARTSSTILDNANNIATPIPITTLFV